MTRYLLLLLGGFVLSALSPSWNGWAQEEETATPQVQEVAYPGVAEVVPLSAELLEEVSQFLNKRQEWQSLGVFNERLELAQSRRQKVDSQIQELGDLDQWSFERLVDVRKKVWEERVFLRKDLDALSSMLTVLEAQRGEWEKKKAYWLKWSGVLKDKEAEVPSGAFDKVSAGISQVLAALSGDAAPLVVLQQKVTALQKKNQEILSLVDENLNQRRRELFKKNAPSFLSREYYRQFSPELIRSIFTGLNTVSPLKSDFWKEQSWLLGLHIFLAWAIWRGVRLYRQKGARSEEWEFLLQHGLATSLFVAVMSLGFLYRTPPPLWGFIMISIAVVAASVLVSALLKTWRKRMLVALLACVFIISRALQLVALPQPLYRLYLAGLSILGGALFLWLARRHRAVMTKKVDLYQAALYLGTWVFLLSFLFQIAGFSNLSSRMIESSIHSVFVGLFAVMAQKIGAGGINFFLHRPFVQRGLFFQRFGQELSRRLRHFLNLVIGVYAALYLLEVWGIYDSLFQAWSAIMKAGVSIGERQIRVGMLLGAFVGLYLTMTVSWAFGGVLDAELFSRRNVDRGVRDSVKKLFHYFLVLLGGILVLSFLGIDLKNFAILAGAFGIGIGFGLQNIVNNFVSGLILLFERPIKVGDTIVMDNEWGRVVKIGLRSTIVRTLDMSEIIVPNSDLISEKVSNWTFSSSRARVTVKVGAAYGSDVPTVLEILKEVALDHPGVQREPEPSPLFADFGSSSLDFELRFWIADVNQRLSIASDLRKEVHRRFAERGVEIPFPQRDWHLRSIDEDVLRMLSQRIKEHNDSDIL